MFKKLFLGVIAFIVFANIIKPAKADEGMWLPLLIERLNYVDMQKMGLHLTADEIYSVNHSSMKDASCSLADGCTGEIISKEGLVDYKSSLWLCSQYKHTAQWKRIILRMAFGQRIKMKNFMRRVDCYIPNQDRRCYAKDTWRIER